METCGSPSRTKSKRAITGRAMPGVRNLLRHGSFNGLLQRREIRRDDERPFAELDRLRTSAALGSNDGVSLTMEAVSVSGTTSEFCTLIQQQRASRACSSRAAIAWIGDM